jgi:hypothetical protein
MEKKNVRHLESYFYRDDLCDGRYDFPVVKKQTVDLNNLKLIRFSTIVKNEKQDMDATVHFFEYDDRFDEVWKNPSAYLAELKQYKQVLTPDFSMYTNIPLALQIFNTFRNRWLGAYWQKNGIVVIPAVSWGDEWSYEFCFDGIQPGSYVAVSTMGCADVKEAFMDGFIRMCQAIDPIKVVCYAKPFDEMYHYADIIEVPYRRNTRIAPASERQDV